MCVMYSRDVHQDWDPVRPGKKVAGEIFYCQVVGSGWLDMMFKKMTTFINKRGYIALAFIHSSLITDLS